MSREEVLIVLTNKAKRMKVKEWCIALDNVSSYIDSVLGLRYKFLKGERATKEKVFGMIPEMTEEKYAELFRPATEEEINGEFDWDGYQYILKKETKCMTREEKAKRYDEVVERAKIEKEKSRNLGLLEFIDENFPELKESDDERIRKALISVFSNREKYLIDQSFGDITVSEALAWLEKQGKHDMGISEATKQKLEDNLYKALKKETPESWNEFLEKQGEQKLNYNNKELKDVVIAELSKYNRYDLNAPWALDSTGLQYPLYFANLGAKWQGEQKPVNKDGWEFEKGKWYVKTCHTYDGYLIHFQEGHVYQAVSETCITDGYHHASLGSWEIPRYFRPANIDEIPQESEQWSEKDEENLNGIMNFICFHSSLVAGGTDKWYEWLKSLKDRVLPQPKQEWSDVDKDILFRTIDSLKFIKDTISTDPKYAVSIIDIEREITWLKSLRPQSQWKPSDEQMKLLREVQQALLGKDCHNRFVNFMYELKRLREE